MQICNQCHKEVADGMYECPYCGSRALSGLMGNVKTASVAKDENVTVNDNDEPFADAETGEWEKPDVDGSDIPQHYANGNAVKDKEKINIVLLILSICCPIVGFVVFFADKKSQPRTAKVCGIAALVSFIVAFVVQTLVG